jgi:hypothetical protein
MGASEKEECEKIIDLFKPYMTKSNLEQLVKYVAKHGHLGYYKVMQDHICELAEEAGVSQLSPGHPGVLEQN